MSTQTVRLHRWDEIALEKVTEMLSRKIVTGEREMLAQIYLKRGCLVPMHSHESEQMTYILQGALKFLIGGEEITVREGEVLHIPSWVEHQAEALEDTFELDLFSPIRQDWLDHTDDYFHQVTGDMIGRARVVQRCQRRQRGAFVSLAVAVALAWLSAPERAHPRRPASAASPRRRAPHRSRASARSRRRRRRSSPRPTST